MNLRQRGVDIEDGRCILCGQDDESTDHALMQCHFVNACWKEMNIQSVAAMPQAFREYIFLHLNLGDSREEACKVALAAWITWGQRNDRMWNSTILSPNI